MNGMVWLSNYLSDNLGLIINIESRFDFYLIHVKDSKAKLRIKKFLTCFNQSDSDIPHSWWYAKEEGWVEPLGLPLPAPGASSLPKPLITKYNQDIEIRYDVLGLFFWVLTRSEENWRTDVDDLGRFPARHSHAYKNQYLLRPFIDEWMNILSQVLKMHFGNCSSKSFPFRVALTHDVDSPSRYAFAPLPIFIYRLLKDNNKQLLNKLLIVNERINGSIQMLDSDPNNSFDWIMSQSEAHGFVNNFFFMAGRKSKMESEYEITDCRILELIKRISARGHQIGVHPSLGTSRNIELMRSEINTYKQACSLAGVKLKSVESRMHYLRFISTETYSMLADCGINTDSSMGYADHVGFRCGTSRPFKFFSLRGDCVQDIVVQPLIAMHWSMVNPRYMNLTQLQASSILREMALKIKKIGGVFSYLIHNDELVKPESKNQYSRLVEFLANLSSYHSC